MDGIGVLTAGPTTASLRIEHLSKTFPGVKALTDAHLEIQPGSVHALLGHNGCGKSTLVKILAGFYTPDPGATCELGGELIKLGSAEEAQRGDVRFVHQDLGLVAELGVADNVGLVNGFEKKRFGAISWSRQASRTSDLLRSLNLDIDPRRRVADITPVERVAVAVVRAVAGLELGRGLLVLDEPTAALPAHQVDDLFSLIERIRASGTAVLLISHRLDEVMRYADEATVMRNGSVIWTGPTSKMSVRSFSDLIAGRDLEAEREAELHKPDAVSAGSAEVVVRATGIVGKYLRGVDITVQKGEIVGLAGLIGSGRDELPYVLAGAAPSATGCFEFNDRPPIDAVTMRDAQAANVALVPADRVHEGIVAGFSVRENVSLAALPRIRSHSFVSPRSESAFSKRWLAAVSANPAVSDRPITSLSGGNQQKAVIARWLSIGPSLLVLSEPTAGIDIGAREAIYSEMRTRAADGLAMVVASSDAEDLLAVCDRVLVLRDGHVIAELSKEQMSKAAIIGAMEGAHDDKNESE